MSNIDQNHEMLAEKDLEEVNGGFSVSGMISSAADGISDFGSTVGRVTKHAAGELTSGRSYPFKGLVDSYYDGGKMVYDMG